jgi:hypothetical protein
MASVLPPRAGGGKPTTDPRRRNPSRVQIPHLFGALHSPVVVRTKISLENPGTIGLSEASSKGNGTARPRSGVRTAAQAKAPVASHDHLARSRQEREPGPLFPV